MRAGRYIVAALAVAALAACSTAQAEPHRTTEPTKAEIQENAKEKAAAEGTGVVIYGLAVHDALVWQYIEAAYQADVERFYEAAAYAASREASAKSPVRPVQRPPAKVMAPRVVSGGATGSCGGATNGADQFIGRESGGNPNARNPSGAWGCYQIMPSTWASSCSDLGQHGSASTQAQAACASRLPSSAWAASGG